ncbi:hypothetical protein [Leifsonia sp. SIMBA_070]|uniref:hypothetical protein n=1 Tax=Leifsonia sp. SIMBA_070 TaxID=3085810 RepID=UPI00397E6779
MTDSRDEQEPVTGNDPTNGLAGDLEGDDGGAVQPTADRDVIQDVIPDLDDARRPDEDADSATSYSEEGKP